MSELEPLFERVTNATGHDRGLDVDLCLALGYIGSFHAPLNLRRSPDDEFWLDYEADEDGDGRLIDCTDRAPELTGSMDAALRLVEHVLGKHWLWEIKSGIGFRCILWTLETDYDDRFPPTGHSSASAPLAILAAMLRALAEREAHA